MARLFELGALTEHPQMGPAGMLGLLPDHSSSTNSR
jgi:hypothetical protein